MYAGRTITADALESAASATGGYPFMIQLVGNHSYRRRPERDTIYLDDVEEGNEAARRRLGRLVIEPELSGLVRRRSNLPARDGARRCASMMADVQRRPVDGVNANYASQYPAAPARRRGHRVNQARLRRLRIAGDARLPARSRGGRCASGARRRTAAHLGASGRGRGPPRCVPCYPHLRVVRSRTPLVHRGVTTRLRRA